MPSLDLEIFQAVNQFAGKYEWLDKFGVFLAELAIVALLVLVILLWFMDWGLPRKQNQYAVIMALEALILGRGILTTVIRELWPRLRPFVENQANVLISQSPLEPGLPSGHAVMAFTLALPVFLYNRRAGIWLIFIALVISAARIFVGVHYPTDILAGIMLSLFVVFFLNFFREIFVGPVVRLLRRER